MAISALIIVVGLVWIVKTEKRLSKFFLGKKAKDLEETIATLSNDIEMLKLTKKATENEIAVMTGCRITTGAAAYLIGLPCFGAPRS